MQKDISALTGIVEQFVHYNNSKGKSIDFLPLVRTVELKNSERCFSTSSKPLRSDEVISVSQNQYSFEYDAVSHF